MKCEVSCGTDQADCDYRAYVHAGKVDLYASVCEYSDDNGGPATHLSKFASIAGDDRLFEFYQKPHLFKESGGFFLRNEIELCFND